jgi:hypothetical protein
MFSRAVNDEALFSGIISRFKHILICASDPGGAEVLSSWTKQQPKKFDYLLAGPALEIFNRKVPGLCTLIKMEDIDHELVIASLGWQTDFEFEAISKASNSGAKVAIFLDHYGNYSLSKKSRTIKVDWVIAFDHISEDKAINEIPGATVLRIPNLYEREIVGKINKIKQSTSVENNILFLTEPNIENGEYGDLDSLVFLFESLRQSKIFNTSILIRVHPSEDIEKYVASIPLDFTCVRFSKGRSLDYDIGTSNYVVGCYTTALRIAYASGRPVFSALRKPPRDVETVPYIPLTNLVNVLEDLAEQ